MPGTTNVPKTLNVSMDTGKEGEDDEPGELNINPDSFKIEDSKFEWSSRAKILKESLDQLVVALRRVDKKYQQLTRWDSELQSQKTKIEMKKSKI